MWEWDICVCVCFRIFHNNFHIAFNYSPYSLLPSKLWWRQKMPYHIHWYAWSNRFSFRSVVTGVCVIPVRIYESALQSGKSQIAPNGNSSDDDAKQKLQCCICCLCVCSTEIIQFPFENGIFMLLWFFVYFTDKNN